MNENIYIELLKQYQAGTISESDRHVLERAALDNPILFDAVEGYSVYGSADDVKALEDLSKLGKSKEGKTRWLNSRIIGVAASLVALIAITFLIQSQLNTDTTNKNLATASGDVSKDNVPLSQVYSTNKEEELLLDTQQESEVLHEANEIIEKEASTMSNVPSAEIQSPPMVSTPPLNHTAKDISMTADDQVINKKASQPELEEAESDIDFASKESKMASPESSKNRSKVSKSKPESDAISYADTDGKEDLILGKVLDIDGNYLAGVTVYIENTEISTVTDFDGNFKLPKYESGHQMITNYTGYQSQKVLLGDNNYYQIVMPLKEESLSEVTAAIPQEVDKNKAFPSMGMEDFELYVSKNKEYPLEVFGTTKSGQFKVSFNVNPDGSLSHFMDESENCDECFKEAQRLLKGSGKWETIPAGQLYRTSYSFEF